MKTTVTADSAELKRSKYKTKVMSTIDKLFQIHIIMNSLKQSTYIPLPFQFQASINVNSMLFLQKEQIQKFSHRNSVVQNKIIIIED